MLPAVGPVAHPRVQTDEDDDGRAELHAEPDEQGDVEISERLEDEVEVEIQTGTRRVEISLYHDARLPSSFGEIVQRDLRDENDQNGREDIS